MNRVVRLCFPVVLAGVLLCSCASEKATEIKEITYPDEPPKTEWMDKSATGSLEQWGLLNAHDPSIYKDDDGWYYVYSTDAEVSNAAKMGIQIRKSKDLVGWEFVGWAMEGLPVGLPQEIREVVTPMTLWAPDIVKVDGQYRLYYSASAFGKNTSCISMAVSDRPEGPFVHQGIVLKTGAGDPVNAIDPNIITDEATGKMYMCYGSFWSGIYLLELDPETGMAKEEGFGINLAARAASVSGAVEGPYIKYNSETGYYYLFVSYDSLSSDYNIRVGRSKAITGPYLDYHGKAMTDTSGNPMETGYKLTNGYSFPEESGWMALGHNSVLEENGEWFLIHHARVEQDQAWHYLQVRKMLWSQDGWPLASMELYAGEEQQDIGAGSLVGDYQRLKFVNSTLASTTETNPMRLNDDYTCKVVEAEDGSTKEYSGTWSWQEGKYLTLEFNGIKEEYQVLPSWDWEKWGTTLVLTGKDDDGIGAWAKKTE